MHTVVRFAAPRQVDVVEAPSPPLRPGQVRVRTTASGISAGTEMTAYRGTNPYLTSTWDPTARLFTPRGEGDEGFRYPLEGWGYSEVGRVVEVADGAPPGAPAVGDLVWGIWGHRSEGVLDAAALVGHLLPEGTDPLAGTFVRVGAIALNAVLATGCALGSTVAVVGQGVIGLLATRFAVLSGARVVAVDQLPARRERSLDMGAALAVPAGPDVAAQVRDLTGGRGADAAIDLSGSYAALQEATRIVGADGTVVAAGFYQGEGTALRLGAEFHHNRVQLLASQIGAVPGRLAARWDVARLQSAVVDLLARREPDVTALVTHRFPAERAAEAYRLLDTAPAEVLQAVLTFEGDAA